MSITFKVFETKLEFHDDLKKYYELSCEFQAAHDECFKIVENSFNSKQEPFEIFQKIESAFKLFIDNLINRLSNYGVFDRVANDYLNNNEGFFKLMNATTDYYQCAKNITERNNSIANADKENSRDSIYSSVSGLDYEIISNSIAHHVFYAVQNERAIQKQTAEATDRFRAACEAINSNRDSKITEEINAYYANEYIPTITDALTAFYEYLFSMFTTDLNACGQLDLACVDHIDLQRSNEIINNIDNIDNKQSVFLKAIELCPYNINAYLKGYISYLYPQGLFVKDICGDLIKYFNLEKALNSILVPLSSLCDNAKEYLIKNDYISAKKAYEEIVSIYPQKYYGWLGLLLCETKKFTNLSPEMETVENYYTAVINSLNSDNNELHNNVKTKFNNYLNKLKQYSKLVKERDQAAVEPETLEKYKKYLLGYSLITFIGGPIFVIFLITAISWDILDSETILNLLFFGGLVALNVLLLFSTKSGIKAYEEKSEKYSEKEKEISEFLKAMNNTESIENIL